MLELMGYPPIGKRSCTVPPGNILPLPHAEFVALQDLTLRESERCVGCGDDGVYCYGHGWLCHDCDRDDG